MSGEETYPGVVIGVVKEIDASLGCIKVDFPWMTPPQRSDWASIAALPAGPGTGCYFMPEKDDEVLVAFLHGRLAHPYVVGFLWNKVQKPPESDKDLRVIKTPGGHTLRFEDSAGTKKIVLRTEGGRVVTLDDTVPGKIEIESGNHRIVLDDTPGPGGITIATGGGQQVAMSDAPGSITVSTATSRVVLDPTGVSITAPMVNINSAMVNVSGVLKASVVTAVAYTPGVGNLI